MIKDYKVKVNAGETIARGSSPRVAVGRALEEQFAAPSRFKGADCARLPVKGRGDASNQVHPDKIRRRR